MAQLSLFGDMESDDSSQHSAPSAPSAQQGFLFADMLSDMESTVVHFAATNQIAPAYVAILATSGLDRNQQYLALQRLSAQHMSEHAFSKLCADILQAGRAPLTPMLPGQEPLF